MAATGTAAVTVTLQKQGKGLQKRQKACLLVLSNPPLFGRLLKWVEFLPWWASDCCSIGLN